MRWRSKKEQPLTPNQRKSRRDIRSQTATLVQVANRAEPLTQKLAEPEVTSESERLATQALIAVQTDLHAAIRRETNCCGNLTSSIFSCMGEMSSVGVQKLQAAATKDLQGTFWVPVADNDFFAASITEEDYDFPNE